MPTFFMIVSISLAYLISAKLEQALSANKMESESGVTPKPII